MLVARFLGMFGPQGALPLTTTEESYLWLLRARRRVSALRRHLPAPLHRAVLSRLGRRASDRAERSAGRGSVPRLYRLDDRRRHAACSATPIRCPISPRWNMPGLLAPRVKSASRLRALLSGLFGARGRDRRIRRRLADARRRASARASARAQSRARDATAMLGASMFSVSDKFRVRVFVRDFAHYEQFLPGRRSRADDRRRGLPLCRRRIRLGHGAGHSRRRDHGRCVSGTARELGWTSWMAPNWSKTDETIRKDARFHVVSRLGARARGG